MFKQAANRKYGEMAAPNCAHRRYGQKEKKKNRVYVRMLTVIQGGSNKTGTVYTC